MKLTKTKLLICFFLTFALYVIVMLNKAQFSAVTVSKPDGQKQQISLPYDSRQDASTGIYVYDLQLQNSPLFSGKMHIRPDDCIEEIQINGVVLGPEHYTFGSCDGRNGFYADLNPFLKSGQNHLQLRIQNTQGHFGLKIIDQTFYEKYVLLSLFLLIISLLDKKLFVRWIRLKFRRLYFAQSAYFQTLLAQLILLSITWGFSLLEQTGSHLFWPMVFQLVALVSLPGSVFLYKKFSSYKIIAFLWIGMVMIFGYYLMNLSHKLFSYDYQGHIDYVRYLIQNGHAPISTGGWSFYHPSFYYRLCSILWSVLDFGKQMTEEDFLKTCQACSLLLFIGYISVSLKTLHLMLTQHSAMSTTYKNAVFAIGSAMLMFWPSNATTAVRIGNDALFYLLFITSFYCLLKWWYSGKEHFLMLALLWAAMDVWAKSNGLILFGIIGSLLAIRFFRSSGKSKYYSLIMIFITVFLCTLYYCFREGLTQYFTDPGTPILVANANGLGDDLRVGANLKNFFTFDIISFIKIPFTSSYSDAQGRNSFWFYLLKTSLFGEFSYDTAMLQRLGQTISLLLLCLISMAIVGFIKLKNKRPLLPIYLVLALMALSMVILRIQYPYSSSGDFRYIFPAVVPGLVMAMEGLGTVSRIRPLYRLGIGICSAFVLFSIAFQVLTILNYPTAQ